MKRSLLILTVYLCLIQIIYAQNPDRPLSPSVKYSTAQLQGFDLNAAIKKAEQISAKFSEQQEYLDFLVRQHVASKQKLSHHSNVHETEKTSPLINNNNCNNAGFEYLNFTNWNGYTYTNSAATNWAAFTPAWTPGISTLGINTPMQTFAANVSPSPARHTLITQGPVVNNPPYNCIGYDSIAINPATHLSDIPFHSSYANGVVCRLGTAIGNAETERLSYPINVTLQNCMFRYSYAFVFYYSTHAPGEAAFFSVNVKDLAGNVLSNCGSFYIDELTNDPNVIQASSWAGGAWQNPPNTVNYYKKWTQQTLDLSAYVGQTVIIDFINADCVYGGHWGYTYIDLECSVGQAATNWCGGTGPALLTVPSGFASYQWYGPNSSTPIGGATNDSLTISSPVTGDVYTIQATAATGCTTTYTCTVNPSTVSIQSISSNVSCSGAANGTATVIAAGSGSYTYSWTNVSTGTPVGTNASSISGLPPGTYSVDVSSAGCGQASQTVTVGISPPSYSVQTISDCGSTTVLHSAPGTNYLWYDSSGVISGATLDSITVSFYPGAQYCVSFINSSGCTDSIKYLLEQTTYVSGNIVDYCGNSVTLSAPAGATNVNWYDSNWPHPVIGTGTSVTINNPTNGPWSPYHITYTNATSGCKDSVITYLQVHNVYLAANNINGSCSSNSGSATLNVYNGFIPAYSYTVSGPGSYSYITNTSADSLQLNGLAAGTYTVLLSTSSYCNVTYSFTVGAAPPSYSSQIVSVCGPTATIHAGSGTNYQWYDSSGAINGATMDSISVPFYQGAEYYVSYVDSGGCSDSVKYFIVQTTNISNDTVDYCGNSVTLNLPVSATNAILYDANWPYAVIDTGSSVTITNPVGPMAPYYLTYTNGSTGCKDSVRTFLQPHNIYLTEGNVQQVCSVNSTPGSVTIHINNGFAPPYTYSVSGPGSYYFTTSTSTDSLQLTGLTPGTYSVLIATNSYCNVTDSFYISDASSASIISSPNIICNNDSVTLQLDEFISPQAYCQSATSSCTSPTIQQAGNGTLLNTGTTWPTVYGNWYANEKYQILYTASDLLAAGMSAGKISSIGFDISSIPTGINTQFINYTIKISCTNVQTLTSSSAFVGAPFVTVFGPQTINIFATGWKTHQFMQPYLWDGTSNLVVEICYDWLAPGSFSGNVVVNQIATSYASFLVYNSDTQPSCGQSVYSSSYSQRPNTRFGICTAAPTNFTYSWAPPTGLSSSSTQTVVATPTVTTNYTVTATPNGGGCPRVDSVTVYVNQIPQPLITQNGDTLFASQGSGYQWLLNGQPLSGATAQTYFATQSGTYAVIVAYNNCGQDTSAPISILVTGMTENENDNFITVFPNPATHQFTLLTRNMDRAQFELYNIAGELIVLGQTEKNKVTIISASDLANGIYFLHVRNNESAQVKKIIIEK